jgi:hypothetical protein
LQLAAVPPAIFAAAMCGQLFHETPLSTADVFLIAQQRGVTWITLSNARLISIAVVIGTIVIFIIIPGLLGIVLIFFARKLGQKAYDIKALALYKEINEGQRKTFSVFLRPFYVTNRLSEEGIVYPPITPWAFLTDPNYHLETQFVKAMRWISPIIGLGRPGEAFGVGRILVSEEDWRGVAAKLIDLAAYIICIPSSRTGTLWELDYIAERGLLYKTIFVMPPLPPKGLFSRKRFELSDDWDKLVIEAKKRGIPFPEYENRAVLFCVRSTSSIEKMEFKLNSFRSIRKSVKALIKMQQAGREGAPLLGSIPMADAAS